MVGYLELGMLSGCHLRRIDGYLDETDHVDTAWMGRRLGALASQSCAWSVKTT